MPACIPFAWPADAIFLLLAAVFVVLVAIARDRTKTAAVLYVGSLPFVDLPVSRYSGANALALVAVALVLLGFSLIREGALRERAGRPLLLAVLPLPLLVGWAALSCALSPPARWDAWVRLFSLALTCVLVLLSARRAAVARAMAVAFVAATAVVSAVAVVQFAWGRFFWGIGRTYQPDYSYFIEVAPGLVRAPGAFLGPNNLGLFTAVAFLIVASALTASPRRHRFPLAGLGILLLGGMASSLTRSAGVIVALGLVVLWRRALASRRRGLLLVGVAITAALVGLLRWGGGQSEQMSSQQHRALYWKAAARMALDHPLFGVGLGRFGKVFAANATELPVKVAALPKHDPHNAYLQLAAETGAVSLAAFLAFVGLPLLRLLMRDDPPARLSAAVLVAVLVHAFFHNVLLQDLLWLAAGVAVAMASLPQSSEVTQP